MIQLSPSRRPNNHLLASLSQADFALLQPHFAAVDLPLRKILEAQNKPIRYVYFPEAGLVSVVAMGGNDREIEAGIIGRDGMTGMAVMLGTDRSPDASFVQVAGRGLGIESSALLEAMQQSATLRGCFLRFVRAFMTQMAQTTLANGRAKIEERLARWLLMASDRLNADALPLTHEFLGIMLGVRRAGVTMALQALQKRKLISSKRGAIELLNRRKLEKTANGFYGVAEAEYRRLTGWDSRRGPRP